MKEKEKEKNRTAKGMVSDILQIKKNELSYPLKKIHLKKKYQYFNP